MNKWSISIFENNSTFQKAGLVILLIFCLIPTVLAIFYAPISADSALYLSTVELINRGFDPYVDLKFGYTPLFIYLMVLLKKIFSIGINYEFFFFFKNKI